MSEEGLLNDFMEAIDQNNILRAVSLMGKACIEKDMLEITVQKTQESDFNY